jgi:hypothetical protein
VLKGSEVIGLPWISIWAFLRVATNQRLWRQPVDLAKCWAAIEEWLGQPGVVAIYPGPRHSEILQRLITEHRAYGPLVTDAALAATDQDFRRFPDLRWVNPLAAR